MIVGRNHVNQKKAQSFETPFLGRFFVQANMEFHQLSAIFYAKFGNCKEVLVKETRPYYVLLLELDDLTYAIPLRSQITHYYCFIADSARGQNSGLDYSKAVVITDTARYIDPTPVTIRQHEYNVYKQHERLIRKQFSSYVSLYKKETRRRQKNPNLPVSAICRFSSLKHFHRELGL